MARIEPAGLGAAPTLIGTLWPSERGGLARAVGLAVLGSLALYLSAKIKVPFYPVPMTMQSLVVLVLGMAYGWRLGLATIILYLAEGAAGLPVFADTPEKGIGIAYMAGPTGGFLLGFVLAATLLGWLAERGWDRSLPRTAIAMVAGHLVLFMPGVAWLTVLFGWTQAVRFGISPFILATVLKTGLGIALMPAAWSLVGRRS